MFYVVIWKLATLGTWVMYTVQLGQFYAFKDQWIMSVPSILILIVCARRVCNEMSGLKCEEMQTGHAYSKLCVVMLLESH
jgi:hypothetical protein